MKRLPDFKFELPVWDSGFQALGIDEAGRGAFAGPLAVGGVVFSQDFATKILQMGINDSKLLSPKKRESLYVEIKKYAIFSHVEFVNLEIINEIGIGKATLVGMEKIANKALNQFKDAHCLVDAFKIPNITNQTAIIHGDRLSISIGAASILAKVERDKLMSVLSKDFPQYGFERHKGYGTLFHRNALKKFGSSMHHRKEFCKNHV